MTAIKGFVAGALSVITVMSAAWWLMRTAGFIPASQNPLWSLTPSVPVWALDLVKPGLGISIPRVVNLAFWGGVWGLVLNLLFRGLNGASYWIAWFLAGAIAVAGTAIFIVPTLKGIPISNLAPQRFMVSGFLNGMFGLGCAIWIMLLGRPRRHRL